MLSLVLKPLPLYLPPSLLVFSPLLWSLIIPPLVETLGVYGVCNSCTMDIKGVLDLYYRGQFYVFPEGAARGNTYNCSRWYITIHTQISMVQVARPWQIMLLFLPIMLLSSAPNSAYYACQKNPLYPILTS